MPRKNRVQVRFTDEEMEFIEYIVEKYNVQKSDLVRTFFNMSRFLVESKELSELMKSHIESGDKK